MKSTFRVTKNAAAFTTVEFMGVMVIAMVLSVIAFAGFHIYKKEMPVKGDAERINYAFANARAQAIANNGYYSVNFDIANHNFWLDETDSAGNTTVHKVTSPEKLNDKVVIDDVLFGLNPAPVQDGIISVLFSPDGSSDDASFYLRLSSADPQVAANIVTVRLYGPTGLSKVFENQRLASHVTS